MSSRGVVRRVLRSRGTTRSRWRQAAVRYCHGLLQGKAVQPASDVSSRCCGYRGRVAGRVRECAAVQRRWGGRRRCVGRRLRRRPRWSSRRPGRRGPTWRTGRGSCAAPAHSRSRSTVPGFRERWSSSRRAGRREAACRSAGLGGRQHPHRICARPTSPSTNSPTGSSPASSRRSPTMVNSSDGSSSVIAPCISRNPIGSTR